MTAPLTLTSELRQAIYDRLTDYCHVLDDGDWDRWPEFFTDDAMYRILTRESHEQGLALGIMYCDGKGMMKDRMLALQTANVFEPHTYCHTISQPALTTDEEGVIGRTNFNVVRTMQSGSMELFAVGKYLDRYAIDGNTVRLASRLVVIDSRRVDILLVAPI